MKITTVRYGKTYSLGNYCSERLDLEATIDETETPEQALLELKERCDNFHKETNQGLYITNTQTNETLTPQQYYPEPQPKKTKDEILLHEINNAKKTEDLNQWKLLATNSKNNEIKSAYELKLTALTTKILNK